MGRQVVIASAARTPLTELGGTLSMVPADQLANIVIREAVERADLDIKAVDEIIMGNVLGRGANEEATLDAKSMPGLGEFTGVLISNEACGSCLMLAALGVTIRYADTVVVGGFENASLCYQSSKQGGTTGRIGEMWHAGFLPDSYFESARLLAGELGLSAQAIDDFASASYSKASEAVRQGKFAPEITPVRVYNARGVATFLHSDELLPFRRSQVQDSHVFATGETIAGIDSHTQASAALATKRKAPFIHDYPLRIVDGAAALVFMSEEKAEKLGIEPLAKVVAWGTSETEPDNEAMASVLAVNNILSKVGMQPDDVDLYEIEEVCSAGVVAIIRKLGIDPRRVNVRGGSLALGYPAGASAGRMLTTLLYTMRDLNAKIGIVSVCIGGMDAISMLVKQN